MNSAVASEHGTLIARHFRRSRWLPFFQLVDGQAAGRTARDGVVIAHARGECRVETRQNHHHGHGPLVAALRGCKAVLCRGIGWRNDEECGRNGIRALAPAAEMSPEKAVHAYPAGSHEPAGGLGRCDEKTSL